MKAQARKALGNERQGLYGTGGGSVNPATLPTKVNEAVLQVIGKSAAGLQNPHDQGRTGPSGNLMFPRKTVVNCFFCLKTLYMPEVKRSSMIDGKTLWKTNASIRPPE
ncbi:uncharacterized protein LOC117652980 [Thrips palmi]|uniref:Uncharacterized protein LOC117652980 n=1 Tax=Thrips palmi TaxID=161013 RepID=A0A6P9A825_THRPL|nr:uncharacterized protein LOC117652980 [Thrips palmi]